MEWGYGPTCEGVVEDEGAAYASLWSVKGDKTMPTEHHVTPESTAFLKTLRGDDKNFGSEALLCEGDSDYDAIGRVWASGRAETIDKPANDQHFTRKQLAKGLQHHQDLLESLCRRCLGVGL